jgi:very-short-patch-repair endonuclease
MNKEYLKFLKFIKKIYKNINWKNSDVVENMRIVWLGLMCKSSYSVTKHFFDKNNVLFLLGFKDIDKSYRLNSIRYWVLRGWSEEHAKRKVFEIQSETTKKSLSKYGCSVSSKKYLKLQGKSDLEISDIMQNRNRVTFADLSKEELLCISKKASEARKIQIASLKETNPQLLKTQFNTTLEYYISRNHSYKDSVVLLKSRQTTFSLEKLKEKFSDEEAFSIWKTRQQKWQTTINNKSCDELKHINSKKSITLKNLQRKYGDENGKKRYFDILKNRKTCNSKEANLFFERLISKINFNEEPYWSGGFTKKEYFLYDETINKFYFYDFVLKNKKVIIEYHGESFHPRKEKLNEEEWKAWKVPFTCESADSKYAFDMRKNTFAEKNGFKIIEIWSSDNFEYSVEKIVKCIMCLQTNEEL